MGLAYEFPLFILLSVTFKEKMEALQEEQGPPRISVRSLAGRRWLLTYGMELAMVKCLKSTEYQGILGIALRGPFGLNGMKEGLAPVMEHWNSRNLHFPPSVAYNPENAKNNYT
ncbi:hypothetical protein Tco_0951686 [Tanacetum coccineum]|uniref:Uncharacterized protein n=1 Tax=Tanacetum coccineum TaxID=301880 RepID=A0ABQ5DUV5_9ASTR